MKEIFANIVENVAGEFLALLIGVVAMWLYSRFQSRKQLTQISKGRLTSSPDHTRVASEANGEIYVMDKSGVHNVTNHPAIDEVVVWSPDSELIAFVSKRDSDWQVWCVDVESKKTVRLTEMQGGPRPIKWDGDGNLIVRLGGSSLTIWNHEIKKRLA